MLRRLAPAKVNLYLHVTGRRPDGYHLLDSLVAFAGIGDSVTAAPGAALRLTVTGPYAGPAGNGEDNLVLRAARGLAALVGAEAKSKLGAELTLDKHLPVAAGLGGGSSDAAAALRLLLELWAVSPEPDALDRLALSLGADLPVCLRGQPAVMTGIGEQVAPTVLPTAHLVLANPRVELPTPRVFGALAGRFSPPPPAWVPPSGLAGLVDALAARRNDLERPAVELAPAVGQVLERLARLPGALLARMSGSGATCFALFADAAGARAAARLLAAEQPDWWVADGPLLADAWA
jgi:4-diphosphocytidyl-2-C-methyl-D-erythritol kinase